MPGRTNTRAEKEAAVAWRSDALETALRTTAPTLQAPAPPSRDEAGRQLEERLRERETTMEQTLRDLLQLRDMVDRSPAILGIAYDQLEHPMVYLSEGSACSDTRRRSSPAVGAAGLTLSTRMTEPGSGRNARDGRPPSP